MLDESIDGSNSWGQHGMDSVGSVGSISSVGCFNFNDNIGHSISLKSDSKNGISFEQHSDHNSETPTFSIGPKNSSLLTGSTLSARSNSSSHSLDSLNSSSSFISPPGGLIAQSFTGINSSQSGKFGSMKSRSQHTGMQDSTPGLMDNRDSSQSPLLIHGVGYITNL